MVSARLVWMRVLLGLAMSALLGSCQGETPTAPGPGVAIGVAALSLQGVTGATWTVSVDNGLGDRVWSKTLTSEQFGDGAGALSYVGPCDASAGAEQNTVSPSTTAEAAVETL